MAAESMVNVNRAIRQNLSDEEIERHIDDIVLLKTGFVYDAPKDFAVGMVMAIPSILRMETEQQLRLINTTTDFISDMSHHGVEAAIHKQKVIQQARNDQIREAIRQGFKNWKKKMATDPRFVGKEGGLLILNFAMAIWTGTSMAERTAARALSPAAVEAEPAVAVGSAAEMERIELGIPWLRRTATGRWQLPNGRWASSDIVNRVLTPELRELYELSTPNGLRAARILPGTNGKIAVIARGQDDVVEEMAKILRSKGYDIETIRNVPGSQDAWNEFRDVVRSKRQMFGPNYQLTDAELRESSFYKLDEMWTIGVRDGHYTIIDMGDPFKRGYSGFLNMEYEQTFNWIGR